jgi:hypothetical protein
VLLGAAFYVIGASIGHAATITTDPAIDSFVFKNTDPKLPATDFQGTLISSPVPGIGFNVAKGTGGVTFPGKPMGLLPLQGGFFGQLPRKSHV